MALPNYVGPGQTYVTPELLASQNLNAALDVGGGPNLTNQLVGNLSGALKGELPADTKQLLEQKAAQDAVSSGTSGSQFANYQGLRTLGLTSLDRMQHAEDSLINPLLGYHPPFLIPKRPETPWPRAYEGGGGGFRNTMPGYNVGPILSGGGVAPGRASNPTLPNYQQGGGGTSTGNILNDLLSKYGPLGNSGSSPMGTNAGFGPLGMPDEYANTDYGLNGQDWAQTTPSYGADQTYNDMQGLAGLGYDPQALGYPSMDNLGYADQPSPEVLAQQALYE